MAETGPHKHGDDWTGYFIRGDEAMGWWSVVLNGAADVLEGKSSDDPEIHARLCKALSAELRGFVAEFKRCYEHG